jgi:hypothetical protein
MQLPKKSQQKIQQKKNRFLIMGEKKEPLNEPWMKSPDNLGRKGDLPHDLGNSVIFMATLLQVYGGGKNPDKIKEALRGVQTFDEYYGDIAKKYSEAEIEEGREPFDINASIEAQRAVVKKQEAITRFDKKIAELKAMADVEVLDEEKILKIIFEDIYPIIYGEKFER